MTVVMAITIMATAIVYAARVREGNRAGKKIQHKQNNNKRHIRNSFF